MKPIDDEGLAEERTALAWSRSSVALLACGAAVLKGVPHLASPRGRPIAGAVIVVLAVAAAVVGSWEERTRRRAVTTAGGVIDANAIRRVAYANALIGIVAFALATLSS
ncbi:MAG TPA: DUF202 domain-containing protein [Acidimicrobiales bacterium]|nr:DUF202 domain-containing protein [Acidimicrobiales bacterium]